MAAGKIRTVRNLLITPEFTQFHPGLVGILRSSLDGGWKMFEAWYAHQDVHERRGCFSMGQFDMEKGF